MKKIYFLIITILFHSTASAQIHYQQYFDGTDTSATNSLIIHLDTSSSNVWQIGAPHKAIFDSAATYPNAIVTDTVNNYPPNNISRFSFITTPFMTWGILAIRWKQKLDLVKHHDGAIVEFSIDKGTTWSNAFNSPHVYNFYGFDRANKDTLATGEPCFSGTDSAWKDIWFCFDNSYLSSLGDSVIIRFTLKSDSTSNKGEGWMIDNMISSVTYVHIVKNVKQTEYLRVYPTSTTGIVNIEAEKIEDYHIIESMQLTDMKGEVVEEYGRAPTKYFIDISNHPSGLYYLKVNTNIKSKTFPIFLKK
ncbi:MAG: T9SS type A sorting domain-containing protein [Flavipsychrobacter sp.]|nr:T9SS type A sorting domain-containing protein [Flavipsychrobacter sp.]